jgi:hypothetical protein
VKVAETTQTVFVGVGTDTPVIFGLPVYFDDDGDGFTNLAELESGKNPNDPTDRPPAEFVRSSRNYVMADVVGSSFSVGESKSRDYRLITEP